MKFAFPVFLLSLFFGLPLKSNQRSFRNYNSLGFRLVAEGAANGRVECLIGGIGVAAQLLIDKCRPPVAQVQDLFL